MTTTMTEKPTNPPISLTIDGREIEVASGMTLLQACEEAGVEIPRFCYHERLSIAGNCRMCLVEVEGVPKPVASCAMPAAPGMVVNTKSSMTETARKGVMEFMLINHPLDCPICDQGGECDLQDQAMAYGFADSRYQEAKRAVENKHMGPLISTIMTRCIHCTRCVRFATEIAGVNDLGAVGRGEDMEITTYLEKALASELSGNVVDLCPVGALTSRPYAFAARSWELTHTPSIDVMDGVGSNTRLDSRGNQVMRVLPRIHDEVNEEWISDKARHAIDGLLRQRLDRPYISISIGDKSKNGRLVECDWDDAFAVIKKAMAAAKPQAIGALCGDQSDAESIYALKALMTQLNAPNMDCRGGAVGIGEASHGRGGYLFNSTIAGIDRTDAILLIGANPRHEAAVLNARIRQRWLNSDVEIFRIGREVDLTYPVTELGEDASVLTTLATGGNSKVASAIKALTRAKRPMLILGMSALNRPDSKHIVQATLSLAHSINAIRPDWNGYNILHTGAGRVAGLDIGFVPDAKAGGMSAKAMCAALAEGKLKVLYNMGVDDGEVLAHLPPAHARPKDSLVIYQGSHGDMGASLADVVLPGAAWCEKDGLYINLEGRVQQAHRAVFPPGDAREDWAIIRALSSVIKKPLPFNSHQALRAALIADHPVFATLDTITPAPIDSLKQSAKPGAINPTPLIYSIGMAEMATNAAPSNTPVNFYMTCPISRASVTMAECVKAFATPPVTKEAAE